MSNDNQLTTWPTVLLGDLKYFEFASGLWTGKKPPFRTARVLRNTNFRSDGTLNYDDVALVEVEDRHFARKSLRPGDILIERSGGGPKQPVGRVAYFDGSPDQFAFSNFTSRLRVIDRERFEPRFVHYVLHNLHVSGGTLSLQQHTTGIRNLDFTAYLETSVPMPPLEEQRRYVTLLLTIQKNEWAANERKHLLTKLFVSTLSGVMSGEIRHRNEGSQA